ncbi:MAG TPA: GTP-binding protein [Kofleriaceae bacterium]|nr:GTP-binding protein [Kofleriaceae bacterium]
MTSRIPVTVLTGFLGSGKTTLLNRILDEHHGQRIAVIENELGEIGIDQALVIKADEEIFEMNNGCICCTVRGDLIRVLGNLVKRRDRFDRVIIETTGMANPGPVAQTFFVDEDIRVEFRLDGIVTLVDARHLALHLGEQPEAFAQVAFADVLVINKTDLVDEVQLAAIERRVRGINAAARVLRGSHGRVPLAQVLDVGGFDLDRALATCPTFLDPAYPFEWAGAYELEPGAYTLELSPGPEPSLRVLVERIPDLTFATLEVTAERVFRRMTGDLPAIASGGLVPVDGRAVELVIGATPCEFQLSFDEGGRFALFTQHLPSEVALALFNPRGRYVATAAELELAAAHGPRPRWLDLVGRPGVRAFTCCSTGAPIARGETPRGPAGWCSSAGAWTAPRCARG